MNGTEQSGAWRRLHPVTPLLNVLSVAYVILLIALFGSVELGWIGVGLWSLAGVLVVVSALKYLRFKYQVNDDSLIIAEGILFRRRRVIPRSRIQNIDLRAGLVQQLTGVVEARIESAGGESTEAKLRYISRGVGLRLRETLVSLSTEARLDRAVAALGSPTLAPVDADAAGELEKRIGLVDLAIAGATSNRAGLLVGVLFGGDFVFDFMPTEWLLGRVIPERYLETEVAVQTLIEAAQSDFRAFLIGASALAVLFGLAGWGASVLLSVIRYYGFCLDVGSGELRVSYGLLTRREKSFRRSRIQNVQIEEPILRRWLGLAALRVQTAGYGPSVKADEKMEMLAPIARLKELPDYLTAAFPDLDLESVQWRRSHPKARQRLFVRRAAPLVAASAALWLFVTPWGLALLVGLLPAWMMATLHYRHLGHSRSGDFVLTREGFWTRRTYIVPVRKIQSLRLRETPFQRRLGLATVTLETAGSPLDWHAPRSVDVGREYGQEMIGGLADDVTATGLTF